MYTEDYKGYEIQMGHESEPFSTYAKVFNGNNERVIKLESWGTNWKDAVRKVKSKINRGA